MKTKILVGLILVFAIASVAYASYLPDDVEEFYNDCGYICYVWPDGSGDCYPCLVCDVTPEPTVIPPITETPEPTEKLACNRGLARV